MSELVRLRLLGPAQIERKGQPAGCPASGKALALLGYLAVRDQALAREHLADLFWPEKPADRGRANLSWLLHQLNDRLPDCLEADRHTIHFKRGPPRWLDLDAFAGLLARGDTPSLTEAVDLYRGDLLEGLHLDGCADFEIWLVGERERWRRRAARALRELVTHRDRSGERRQGLHYARRLLDLEPWLEETHRQVMRLLALDGRRAAALAQYEACCSILAEELDVEPGPETVDLYTQIRDGELPVPAPYPIPPLPVRRHNLPVQPTPFVGRKAELAELASLLADPDVRLLTILGAGGMGKTRLALQAAAAELDSFEHGIYFVSLAPLQAVEAIVPTVAEALSFSFYQGSEPRQQLLHYLQQKTLLIVMDSFEHLLDSVDLVSDILQTAPQVKILSTSRAGLKVQGEYLFHLAGMDFPDWEKPEDAAESEGRGEYSAVKLFLQSARRARPGFELAAGDLLHVSRICRLVQGMPLGILLAAAWLEMLPPVEIAAEIRRSLDFLETDLHDVPERQRSMRAVFDHSWKLLTEGEREVFQGLSVFRGGFTRKAAEQVTGASLRELRALVNRSLLGRDTRGRYEIHELLRQYASEKLGEVAAQEEATRDLHCAYYAEFLQMREAQLVGGHQQEALVEIGVEIENVRAAWDWAVVHGDTENINRCLDSLAEFYHVRAWYQQGDESFARAAQRLLGVRGEIVDSESKMALGRVLLQLGRFCDSLGHMERGRGVLQESLALFRDLGARREMGYALCYLGGLAHAQVEGKPLYQQGLAVLEEVGDRRGMALCLGDLGWVTIHQGDYNAAKQLLQESVDIFRELGSQGGIASSLRRLGYANWILGEYGEAKQLHQESLALYRELGDQRGIARSLDSLSIDAAGSEEHEEAKQLREESLAIHKGIGYARGIIFALGDLGSIANRRGKHAEAIELAQDGLALSKRIDDKFGIAWSFRVLGSAACGLGNLQGAREYFFQALEMSAAFRLIPLVLRTVVGIAALLAAEGDRERALELLALILHHSVSWQVTKDKASRLIAGLEAELLPEVVAAAQKRGRARDLDATVAELLHELGGTGMDSPDQMALSLLETS
jgi:predicted ATPase/DNA-binding SARP family transcriptional activator